VIRRSRLRAAAAALALASAVLLTACGPGAGTAPAGNSAPDSAQVQDMQQKLDSAESAAAQADDDAGKEP